MPGDLSSLGDLVVTVGGDLSPLEAAVAQIGPTVQAATGNIEAAFASLQGPLSAVDQQMTLLDSSIGNLGSAVNGQLTLFDQWANAMDPVAKTLAQVAGAADQVATSAGAATPSLMDLVPAAKNVSSASDDAEKSLRQMAGALVALAGAMAVFETLKTVVVDALTAFGNLEKADIAMTALTGSAATASAELEKLKAFSLSDALEFPAVVRAEQRMVALGVSLHEIPGFLQAAANSAAAMNSSFGTAVNMLDRFVAGGTILARSVASLGLTMKELADVMGVSEKAVTATFKALDIGDRVVVLNQALEKFKGTAEEVAKGVAGAWQNLQTQFTFILQDLGKALAPVALQFIEFTKSTIVPFIQSVVKAFSELPLPVKDVIAVLGVLLVTIPPLLIGIALVVKAFAAFEILTTVGGLFSGLTAGMVGVEAGALGLAGTLGTVVVPILATAGAFVALDAAITGDSLDTYTSNLKELGTSIKNLVVPAAEDFVVTVKKIAPVVAEWVGQMILSDAELKFLREHFRSDDFVAFQKHIWSINGAMKDLADGIQFVTGRFVDMDAAMKNAVVTSQNVTAQMMHDAIVLGTTTDNLTISQRSLLKAVQDQQDTLAGAKQKVADLTAMQEKGINVAGLLAKAQDDVRKAMEAMDPAVKVAEQAAKKAESFNQSWELSARKALDSIKAMEQGEKEAAGVVTALQGVIENANLKWDQMSEKSRGVFAKLIDGLKEAQAAEVEAANNQALDKIALKVHNIEIATSEMADKVPADFASMMSKVSQGDNFGGLQKQLENAITKLHELARTAGPELAAGIQITIDKTDAAVAHLKDMNSALKLIGQDTAMDKLAAEITGLVKEADKGEISFTQFNEGMVNVGAALAKTVIPAMEKGIPVTQQLLDALRSAGPVGAQFADGLAKGIDAANNTLTTFSEKARASVLSVDQAIKDLGGQSMDTLRAQATRFGDDISKAFSGIQSSVAMSTGEFRNNQAITLDWANKVWPAIQAGVPITQDVLDAVAKIAPALASAATQGADVFARAMANLKAAIDGTNNSLGTMIQSLNLAGTLAQALAMDFGLASKSGGTLITGGAPVLVQQFHDGALVGSALLNAPPPAPPVSRTGASPNIPAPIVQQPTISAADTGQLAGLLSTIELDLRNILTALTGLTTGPITVLNTTTAALNTTVATVAASTTALVDTTTGLQTAATGLTTGFAQTAQALQTVAVVTAVGTAAMLTGIQQAVSVIAPVAVATSPQWARVPLSQLGVTSTAGGMSLGGGGLTINIPIHGGTFVGANGVQEFTKIVGENLINILQQNGIRVQ